MENENYIDINPEYVYLTIPSEWVCVYHKLLSYMADFGKTIIDDCNAACKGNGKNIINCWNLFQSAIACRSLGREKEAEFFIDYIKKQLDYIYKGSSSQVYNNTVPVTITSDNYLKAIASCSNSIKFTVSVETGKLYETWLGENTDKNEYDIIDDNLIVTNKDNVNKI